MGYKTYNKEEFIERAKQIHGDFYDFSKVDFVNSQVKVTVICPKHGEFKKAPTLILAGQGCPKCGHERGAKKQTCSTEEFVEKAKKVYGDKYDYSKVKYSGKDKNVCIICKEHGEFWQTPHNHLAGHGCPKCAGFMVNNLEDFIKRATEIHKGKYNYEKSEYITTHDNICITCPKHGDFWMMPLNHLRGQGCPQCRNEKLSLERRMSKEEFIEKAIEVHGDKYNYDKVEYTNNRTNVCITCPKHGDFWMRPGNHLNGQCCPSCQQSYLETDVEKFLTFKNIKFEKQKRYKWLGRKSLDFYLPDLNVAIECQGIQHFKPVRFNNVGKYTAKESFDRITKRDKEKLEECTNNNIKLYYYSKLGIEYPYQVYENLEELLNVIQNDNN